MKSSHFSSINQLTNEVVNNLDNLNTSHLIPTGFKSFDAEFCGLSLGELVVVGGRPAMGKTQFIVNLVANICATTPILFFTFDLNAYTLSARFLSNSTAISVQKIVNKSLDKNEKETVKQAATNNVDWKLHISENGLADIEETLNLIKEHVAQFDTKIIVIDYLQLLGNSKHNNGREAEIGHICKLLKKCAKELNICIILLSQLSRAVEVRGSNRKPQLSDLRDSGSIEQIADKVWLLYRPEYYLIDELDDDEYTPSDCILMVIVAKNKNGKMGTGYFKRNEQFTTFDSISKPSEILNIKVSRLFGLENPFKNDADDDIPF